MSTVIDELRQYAPEIVEVAIRAAIQHDITFSQMIRENFLDVMFPFPCNSYVL